MKIISPIDNPGELSGLVDAGADALYGGYVPPDWRDRFSLLTSINQRTFENAQISSRRDLEFIIDNAHAAGRTFCLTLNAPFYTDDQLPCLLDYVDQVVDAGVDGIILADLGLLRRLRKRHPGLELHGSTLAHLSNSEAVRVYIEAGIDRLVMPRHLPVAEMATIASACPDVAFDAFLLVGKCPNTEGLCTFHHASPERIWPCEIPYRIDPVAQDCSPALRSAIDRQQSWSRTNRRHGCGLCAIPYLLEGGLDGLKLVGRGAPAQQKISNVLLAREFLELAVEVDDFDRYRSRAIAAHHDRFGAPCSPNVCYYPEFYRQDT